MLESNLHLVIATHSPGKSLKNTLMAFSKCDIPISFAGTWIVENGSHLLNLELLKAEFPLLNIHYLHLSKACKSAALNLVLSHLERGLMLFADDDIFPFKQWFLAYEQAYQQFQDQFFFGGPFEVAYEQAPLPYVKNFLPRSARGWRLPFKENTISPQWFVGFNWAAPVKSLKLAGGFSMRFGPGTPGGSTGEETQLHLKLTALGFQSVYVPMASVLHPVPKSRCHPLFTLKRHRRMALEKTLSAANRSPSVIPKKMGKTALNYLRILWALRGLNFKYGCYALSSFLFDFLGFLQGLWINLIFTKNKDAHA